MPAAFVSSAILNALLKPVNFVYPVKVSAWGEWGMSSRIIECIGPKWYQL